MTTKYTNPQKTLAIEEHSRKTDVFISKYREMSASPYRSVFTYGRLRLDLYIDRYLPKNGAGLRLLDVGCGTGRYMAMLRDRGFSVAGVDGSKKMLDEARANNPGSELRQADVETIPFPDHSFDFALCVEVLRYLPNPIPCIQEMARVLKPAGTCLATATPLLNSNSYWLVNRLAARIALGKLSRLKQFFTTSGKLRRDFVKAGFSDPRVHGICFVPTVWAERVAPRQCSYFLRACGVADPMLEDKPVLREFSNIFLIQARRA